MKRIDTWNYKKRWKLDNGEKINGGDVEKLYMNFTLGDTIKYVPCYISLEVVQALP